MYITQLKFSSIMIIKEINNKFIYIYPQFVIITNTKY